LSELTTTIEKGWADARRTDPEPTVAYFHNLLTQHPSHPDTLFSYASALDFAGREGDAAPLYEQAFKAGLSGEDLRRGLLQYGSTLRNLNRHNEATAAMQKAATLFPDSDSVKAFYALTLLSAGRPEAAVAQLLTLAVDRISNDDLQEYQAPLRRYAAELAS
jgi:hypothetical protein